MINTNGKPKRLGYDAILMNRLEDLTSQLTRNVSSRSQLWGRGPRGLGDDNLDPRRDINEECGFPETGEVTAVAYYNLFDREPVANRVVTILAKACWAVQPSVYEDEDAKSTTPFEQGWEDLCKGLRNDSWFQDEEGNPVFEHFCRADILSGIGSFGVILLGFSDGLGLEQPVKGYGPISDTVPLGTDAQYLGIELNPPVVPEVTPQGDGAALEGGHVESLDDEIDPIAGGDPEDEEEGSGPSGIKLLFMRSFDESLVQITQYEADKNNPRFGMPVMYRITLNDPHTQHSGVGLPIATVMVHWTRILHLADNLMSSEVFGIPRMRPVLNNIINLQKLSGATGEAAWGGAFPGITFTTNPQLGGDVAVNYNQVEDAVDSYFNRAQRHLIGEAMEIGTIGPQAIDLSPQITNQINLICIQLEVPMRIFMGSERGELASGQDDGNWVGRLKFRQQAYLTPRLICPFIDRMITVGVLPEPKEGYSVKWPELDTVDPKDAAAVATAITNALSSYVSGGCDVLIGPMDFLTHVIGPNLGFDEEVIEEIMKNALKHLQEANPDVDPDDIVHGRNPEPEVDPNSAAGMAGAGVPMPPMVPGDDGPQPYVDPNKVQKKPVKNQLAEFMEQIRRVRANNGTPLEAPSPWNKDVWNFDPFHDPKTGQFTTGGTQTGAGDQKQLGAPPVSKRKQNKASMAYSKSVVDLVQPEYVHPTRKIAEDVEKSRQWYADQDQAFKELHAAAKSAHAHIQDTAKERREETGKRRLGKIKEQRAIDTSKQFIDASSTHYKQYLAESKKIADQAEKKAMKQLAGPPKVRVVGVQGNKKTPVDMVISKDKLEGWLKNNKVETHSITEVGGMSAPEQVKVRTQVKQAIQKHALALLRAGGKGLKVVGEETFQKVLRHVADKAFKAAFSLNSELTINEYNDLSRKDKLVENYSRILYPYLLNYLVNGDTEHDAWGRFAPTSGSANHMSQLAHKTEQESGPKEAAIIHEQAAEEHEAVVGHVSEHQAPYHREMAKAHRARASKLRTGEKVARLKNIVQEAKLGVDEHYTGQDPIDAAVGAVKGGIRGAFNEEMTDNNWDRWDAERGGGSGGEPEEDPMDSLPKQGSPEFKSLKEHLAASEVYAKTGSGSSEDAETRSKSAYEWANKDPKFALMLHENAAIAHRRAALANRSEGKWTKADYHLAKAKEHERLSKHTNNFNPNHDPDTGKFSSGSGDSESHSPSSLFGKASGAVLGAGGIIGGDLAGQSIGGAIGGALGGGLGAAFGNVPGGIAGAAWGATAGSFVGGAIGGTLGGYSGIKAATALGADRTASEVGAGVGGLVGWGKWGKSLLHTAQTAAKDRAKRLGGHALEAGASVAAGTVADRLTVYRSAFQDYKDAGQMYRSVPNAVTKARYNNAKTAWHAVKGVTNEQELVANLESVVANQALPEPIVAFIPIQPKDREAVANYLKADPEQIQFSGPQSLTLDPRVATPFGVGSLIQVTARTGVLLDNEFSELIQNDARYELVDHKIISGGSKEIFYLEEVE